MRIEEVSENSTENNLLKELKEIRWLENYFEYLRLKKFGLKKDAKSVLELFFTEFKKQEKADRRNFINSINKIIWNSQNLNRYLPFNLFHDLIIPELNLWMTDEPLNPIPFKWSYDFDQIKTSLELDSKDQIALELFGNMLINKVGMNQHELSSGFGYQGNPKEDYKLINFYLDFLDNLNNELTKSKLRYNLLELQQCALENTI